MNRTLIPVLVSLLLIGLLSACSNTDKVSPGLLGQWTLSRELTTGVPGSYSATGTATIALDANTYYFRNDSTFDNTYTVVSTSGIASTRTESGRWTLTGSRIILTTTQVTTSTTGQQPATATVSQDLPATYRLTYAVGAGQLTTGPATRRYYVVTAGAGSVTETFSYTEGFVYKKTR